MLAVAEAEADVVAEAVAVGAGVPAEGFLPPGVGLVQHLDRARARDRVAGRPRQLDQPEDRRRHDPQQAVQQARKAQRGQVVLRRVHSAPQLPPA